MDEKPPHEQGNLCLVSSKADAKLRRYKADKSNNINHSNSSKPSANKNSSTREDPAESSPSAFRYEVVLVVVVLVLVLVVGGGEGGVKGRMPPKGGRVV